MKWADPNCQIRNAEPLTLEPLAIPRDVPHPQLLLTNNLPAYAGYAGTWEISSPSA